MNYIITFIFIHILILGILVTIYCNSTALKEPFIPEPDQNDTIFVSIASYRDAECPKTILNLYKNAKTPSKIFVGICQQNDVNDPDCLEELIKNNSEIIPKNNISIVRLPQMDAMGPTYARYMCSKLWNKQTF